MRLTTCIVHQGFANNEEEDMIDRENFVVQDCQICREHDIFCLLEWWYKEYFLNDYLLNNENQYVLIYPDVSEQRICIKN